jgi:hypothetical protein
MSVTFNIEELAYKKLMLHSLKHSKSDCLGLLLGKKSGNVVTVTDAVPLFHNRVMSGLLEVAFEMTECAIKDQGLKIVGVYEAPLTAVESTPTPLGTAMMM